MRFSCFIPQISTLAILLGVASAAVEIRFMRNVADCSGTNYAYWYDIPSYTCYQYSTWDSVHSVKFFNVPGGAVGQVYAGSSGCSNFKEGSGSGTYCLGTNWVSSANWFYPYKKLTRDTQENGPAVSGFQYITAEGEIRRISCAPEDFEKISKLVDDGDYAALAEYPNGKSGNFLQLIVFNALTDH